MILRIHEALAAKIKYVMTEPEESEYNRWKTFLPQEALLKVTHLHNTSCLQVISIRLIKQEQKAFSTVSEQFHTIAYYEERKLTILRERTALN